MLRERRVSKLRAMVCTFPSPERLGGVLDLLAAGYPVKECWLPNRLGVLGKMACRFNGDWPGWLSLMDAAAPLNLPAPGQLGSGRHVPAAMLIGLAATGCPGGPPIIPSRLKTPDDFVTAILEDLARRPTARLRPHDANGGMRALFGSNDFRALALTCCDLILKLAGTVPAGDVRCQAARGLTFAALTSILTEGGPRTRFFRRTKNMQQHLIAQHPLMCLNGKEIQHVAEALHKATPVQIFREACKMFSNGRGLAFQYGDGACGVLFCGDSRLSFVETGTGIPIRKPTVITAPGQGGVASEAAYGRIDSDNPQRDIWVRTHYSYSRKVSDTFKQLPNKLCLNNCKHRSVQEVALEFDGRLWRRLAGNPCICS